MLRSILPALSLPLLVAWTTVPGQDAQEPARDRLLTLEQTSGLGERVSFAPRLTSYRWSDDGLLVRGRGDDQVFLDPRTLEERPAPEGAEEDPEDATDDARRAAFAALEGIDEEAVRSAARPRGRSSGGDVTWHRVGERTFAWSEATGPVDLGVLEGAELEELAPDGGHLAYVAGNDLHVVSIPEGRRRALTSDGDEETFNGKLDWVYQEEVYGRGNFKAFWWSPTGRHIAFLRLDERPVHEFTVVDHIEDGTFRVRPEITNYPKAGDPNPTVMLGVVDVATRGVTWVDLSAYEGEEPLVVRVGWDPAGERVIYEVQDRIQSWLELVAADPESGEPTVLVRESSESWVDVEGLPRWLADGTFLWQSSRTGYRHVYRYRADGTLVNAVTAGEWRVNDIVHLDEEAGTLEFQGTRDGAVDVNHYRIGLDGAGLVRLTSGRGSHSLDWNAERTLFLDEVSSLSDPGELRLCDAEGKVLHVLARAEVPALEEYRTSTWELHEVPARDGYPMDVALLRPVPLEPGASYPVYVNIYSGPDAPSVRNRWNSSTWYQFLAQQGVGVLQVNVRSASGKGHWATSQAYRQLGVVELRDLEDAVAWITAEPWADASRVGITGYSYGGFMTAFALTNSKAFAFGFAGGGVYDWGMYDTIYTERYMSTPQRNPDGYARTSVLAWAGDLHGHLVLHAGVMDDNVHVQNTLQLAYHLQKAGKDFDLMLYPQQRHGVRDRDQRWHLRRLEWNSLQEALAPPGPAGGASGRGNAAATAR